MKLVLRVMIAALTSVFASCAAAIPEADYTAFRDSQPQTLLVLPPLNISVEPAASAAVLAQATYPLAESGYYVVPVGVMEETFKQNGMVSPEDIHALPGAKLREIFGADAALYMTVSQYGSSYQILSSTTTVEIDATLIDLRSGMKLWGGSKILEQGGGSNGGGLIGALVQAVVQQIVNTVSDRSYSLAGMADNELLSAGRRGGILYGPRSPKYETQ